MSAVLPSASVQEVPPAGQIQATAPADVVVCVGTCTKGASGTPEEFGPQAQAGIETFYGAGPLSRELGIIASLVPVQTVGLRVPTHAVAATISAPVQTIDVSSTWTDTLSGTPTDGLDVVLTFPVGGTTGSASPAITYTVSTNGGATTGAPITTLGTGLTITIGGVTITLGSGNTITAGDVVTWWTTPASASILPTTITRASGSSTSTMVFSGTPNDKLEIGVIFPTGGTVGVPGAITLIYSLDYGAGTDATWSAVTTLPTNGVFPIPDHLDATGVTLTVGAGVVVAQDLVVANTTAPGYQWSDVLAGLNTLRNMQIAWSFVCLCGDGTRAMRDQLETLLQSYALTGRFAWGSIAARDKITGETGTPNGNQSGDLAYSGRVVAEWATSIGDRTPPHAGYARVTDPNTSRYNRRPAHVDLIARYIGIAANRDPGDRTLPNQGALPSTVSITSPAGALVEHDAYTNPALFSLGFDVLRRWYGEEGFEPGVYPAGGRLMSGPTDIQRIQQRRVLNLAQAALFAAMSGQVLATFGVWPATAPSGFTPGNIQPWNLSAFMSALWNPIYSAVGALVPSPKTGGIVVIVNPTPAQVAGQTTVYAAVQLASDQWLDFFSATIGYVIPAPV